MTAPEWLCTAHADAWQEIGRWRDTTGGGVARLAGVWLMASGLPHPQWNNGDVFAPELVDIGAVGRWFAERGVPWGVRVPAGMRSPYGASCSPSP
ncbi:MAG TPA: hypothetical protein VHJ79_13575 [Mycobacterium sp.]|nr:hypothetical protein [Mycobacterium sp.]